MQRLKDCLQFLTRQDALNVLMFSPSLGGFDIKYEEDQLGYNYKLTIPFEEKTTSVILNEENLKKLAVMVGIGSKHFDVLCQHPEKLIEDLKELLQLSENDFYFLVSGTGNAVDDVSMNTEPVTFKELFDTIKGWYKTGVNDTNPECSKDWTDEDLDNELYVYFNSEIDGVLSVAFGLKHKNLGGYLKCNRLGSFKPTIYPCWFRQTGTSFVPVIFDIYGITENKPSFKKDVDLQTNVSTILGESEDFLYDNKNKLNFELQRPIDSEHYLKQLSTETKIPKKYIKKGIIGGYTIKDVVNSICNECINLLQSNENEEVNIEDVNKNLIVFEKLCKSAGYATFYQNKCCNQCYKTQTISEENS